MKKIQLLMIGMMIGLSGWVEATVASPLQHERSSAELPALKPAAPVGVEKMSISESDYLVTITPPFYLESVRQSHVPEPEGWAMMLMGAGFVVYQVRRRKRARESWDLR